MKITIETVNPGEEEEIILSPEETIANFKERRESLDAKLDEKLAEIIRLINE